MTFCQTRMHKQSSSAAQRSAPISSAQLQSASASYQLRSTPLSSDQRRTAPINSDQLKIAINAVQPRRAGPTPEGAKHLAGGGHRFLHQTSKRL